MCHLHALQDDGDDREMMVMRIETEHENAHEKRASVQFEQQLNTVHSTAQQQCDCYCCCCCCDTAGFNVRNVRGVATAFGVRLIGMGSLCVHREALRVLVYST